MTPRAALAAEPHSRRAAAEKIRLFLVDDHDVVREGLIAILGRESDFEVVGQAGNAEVAIEDLGRFDPDVVIVDYRLPGMDGIDLCREIAERRLRARVVVLSGFLEEDVIQAAFHAGAFAYVVKDVEAAELKRAVRAAARDEIVLDPKVRSWVTPGTPGRRDPELSQTELQVLRQLRSGKPNRAIAAALGLSLHTVKQYLGEIYAKLGVTSRSAAVAVAMKRGLV